MFAGNLGSMTVRLAPLAMTLAIALLPVARADEAADPPGRVARVNFVVGTVSMQPAGSESWLSDVVNRPLTNGDKLWADRESRAELHVGSAAVRLGGETGAEILNIDDRSVQLKLSAGTLQVRVRALDPEQTFEIATPSASVAVLRPGEYRIEVSETDGLMRIAVAQGQVAVTDQGHEASVETGQLAEYNGGPVDQAQISSLPSGDAFDQWVADRDRREERAVATRYVSREVIGYEDLDDYGSWQSAGEYGPVWVPQVRVGWAPYHYGHWGWIAPWGWTWIDDAPWGFAPFHYGRWVFYGGNWCWAPGPRRYAPVYAPALVGWVGGRHLSVSVSVGGPPVGWFPLGWNEVYVPAYRVSDNYVRNVNVTNIHVTNTVINNYITNNTTVVDGRRTAGGGAAGGRKYANFAVPGAVTATTQAAFTGAQPVASHQVRVPRETLERGPVGTAAPAIAPTAGSLGRPAAFAPRAGAGLWSRPVVARTPTPPPSPSFESQRNAVVANGGLPVPMHAVTAPPAARPGVVPATAKPRADVIAVGPAAAAVRPSEGAPVVAPPYAARPREDHPGPDRPRQERPPEYGPPAARDAAPSVARPAPEYRTPAPVPGDRPPTAREPTPAAQRPTPEYRAPAPTPAPAPAREATPRPAPEYRAPAPARDAAPRPAPEYRAPAPTPAPAREATPRPAPEYRAPAPAPREAPRPPPENRPPPQHEAAPQPPHEARAAPPPHPEKSSKPEQKDKR
jgi:hypothetical protein